MFDDLVPSRFGCGEERSLTLVIATLNVSDEFGSARVTVDDARVDVRAAIEQQVERTDHAILNIIPPGAAAPRDGAPHTAATRSAHACGGHERRDLEYVRYIHLGAMREQYPDRLIVE